MLIFQDREGDTHVLRIHIIRKIRHKFTLFAIKEIDGNEQNEENCANGTIDAEDHDRAQLLDQHATEDGATKLAKSMMHSLDKALSRWTKLRICIVRYERTASGPHCGMCDS